MVVGGVEGEVRGKRRKLEAEVGWKVRPARRMHKALGVDRGNGKAEAAHWSRSFGWY